jgi:hypothetical protein
MEGLALIVMAGEAPASLDAVLSHSNGSPVLVIDSSPPGAGNGRGADDERVIRVDAPATASPAAARNAALRSAPGDTVVFLSSAVEPSDGWLETLLEYAARTPQAAAIGSTALLPDGRIGGPVMAVGADGAAHRMYFGFAADHPAVSRSGSVPALDGDALLVRRDALEQVGGFDEDLPDGLEVVDLCLRLRGAGHEVHICHEAEVTLSGPPPSARVRDDATFSGRWKDHRGEDVGRYAADGLINVRYGLLGRLEVSVSPVLGHSATADADDLAVAQLLDERADQMWQLALENDRIGGRTARRRATAERGEAKLAEQVAETAAAGDMPLAALLVQRTAPLELAVRPDEPERVNLLIPGIDLGHFYGGYITKFQLAVRLAERGAKVRIVVLDHSPAFEHGHVPDVTHAAGLAPGALDDIEISYNFDRSIPLEVSATDAFLATTWWTAHVAHRAVTDMGSSKFVYLIQEYEPLTYPMGSYAALARQSYDFPHLAVFSTQMLREFFENNRLGLFADGGDAAAPGESWVAFQNAITDVGPVTAGQLSRGEPRRLLFYARPSAVAARNMFEVGLVALTRAVRAGVFPGKWEFTGIGAGRFERLGLGDKDPMVEKNEELQLLPRQTLNEYRETLRSHDVGLSLMQTPHPSLVPIEMASSGMSVVTTTFANKTSDALLEISSNFVPVAPTIDAVEEGLRQAVTRTDDLAARVAGSEVDWSSSWPDALNDGVLDAVERFLERCSHPRG